MNADGRILRGRDDEIDVVTQHLQRASGGAGGVLIVEGGPGIGKTSLLSHALNTAAKKSYRCGFASADPNGGGIDMAVLLEALVGGDPPLIPPEALKMSGSPADQRFWLLQDLQTALERLSWQHPVLICLDDLHWADIGSAFGLRMLSQWLATLPVCWILATRPGEGRPAIQRTLGGFASAGARTLALSGVKDDAVAAITSDILGAPPSPTFLEAIGQVDGNPFLLVDLLTGLREDGQVSVAAGTISLTDFRTPRRLATSVQGRLAQASPEGERAAILAASLGRRFRPTELAALSGISVSDLVVPVQEVLRTGLFTVCGERLQFQHDLVREAIRASIPPSMRRALDRDAADALLATGALPAEVADQVADSAEPGDEVAIRVLCDAADALSSTDPSASADVAASALELAPRWHPLRGPLVARRTLSLFAAGRRAEASAFADAALRRSLPAAQEAEVRLGISCMFSLCADIRAENARVVVGLPGIDAIVGARAAASLFHNLVVGGRLEEALKVARKFEESVRAADDDVARYSFDVAESTVEYQLGRFDHALALLDDAELRRRFTVDDSRQRLAHHYRSWILTALDRFDEAAADACEGLASAHRDRQAWAVRLFETWQGRHLLQLGRLDDAVAALEGRFTPEDAHRLVGVVDAAAVLALGRARLHLGDERGTAEIVSIAEILGKAGTPGNRRQAVWFLAFAAMAGGHPNQAHDWVSSLGEQERLNLFPLFPHEATDDAHLIHIALAAGDEELARRTMWLAQQRLELNPAVPTFAAVVAHCEGLLEGRADALRLAVSHFELGPRPLALSAALEDLGCVRLRDGGRDDAVEAFDRALVLNTGAGALRDAARVRRRLRELGVRRRVMLLDRPKTGPQSLTDAELRVARLVAEGCTNRTVADQLFVSPHTVNTHLRHVFEKLAVTSRIELARIMNAPSRLPESLREASQLGNETPPRVTPGPRRPGSSTPAYQGNP